MAEVCNNIGTAAAAADFLVNVCKVSIRQRCITLLAVSSFFPSGHNDWANDVVRALFDSTERLEQLDPVLLVHEQRLDALGLKDNVRVSHVDLDTEDTYDHVEENKKKFSPSIIKSRRQAVLGALLNQQGIAKKNLVLYDALKDYIRKREWTYSNNPDQYVVIHSRWLEGECEKRVGEHLPHDECFMTPSYIKALLGGKIDKPIVLMGWSKERCRSKSQKRY